MFVEGLRQSVRKRDKGRWIRLLMCGSVCVVLLALLSGGFAGCGTPTIPCKVTDDCPRKQVCIDGSCEAGRCLTDKHCAEKEVCDRSSRRCKEDPTSRRSCEVNEDCKGGEICESNRCKTFTNPTGCNPECQEGFECKQSTCVKKPDPQKKCSADLDCTAPNKCNLLAGFCQKPCSQASDCATSATCQDQFCQPKTSGCDANNPCAAPQVCDKGTCVDPECSAAKPCTTPKVCTQGRCVEPGPECSAAKPCTSPKICDKGRCVDPKPGCSAANPCISGSKCFGGKCVPNDYCERANDCPANQRCVQNSCQAQSSGGCKSDSDCTAPKTCVGGQCQTPSNQPKKIGEPCKVSADCVQGAMCFEQSPGNLRCVKLCDPIEKTVTCPTGFGCALLSNKRTGVCLKKIGAGALGPGDKCNPNANKCEVDLLCVQDGAESFCFSVCSTAKQNCAKGKCASVGSDPLGVCEVGSGEGAACKARSDCKNNMYCLGATSGGSGYCTPACDPYNPACKGSKVCALFVNYIGANMQAAVCGPLVGNGREGQLCNHQGTASSCQSNLFCFPNKARPGTGICARPCSPTAPRCPAGKQCLISPLIWKASNLHGCI